MGDVHLTTLICTVMSKGNTSQARHIKTARTGFDIRNERKCKVLEQYRENRLVDLFVGVWNRALEWLKTDANRHAIYILKYHL